MKIGILALQGAFDLHAQLLEQIANNRQIPIEIVFVKTPKNLENLDAIILPGGESTVVSRLLDSSGLNQPLLHALKNGLFAFGTCAGLIILADYFNMIDIKVDRNAYGTQINSFEASVDFLKTNKKCHVFFIRAPKIIDMNENVEPIATYGDSVVGVIHNNILATTFHPEVAGTIDFHDFFVTMISNRVASR